jgi:ethanolamine permease
MRDAPKFGRFSWVFDFLKTKLPIGLACANLRPKRGSVMNQHPSPELKKILKPIHLWSIAVGLVISGEYFGWSYGWAAAGTLGFLVSTILVAIMYTTFVFSFTELTTAIPNAGGPFAYANRALGPWGGFLAGYAALIEFLFAPPAIALALGSYLHFVIPAVPVVYAAILVFIGFTLINLLGVQHTARFELIVTLIAVVELLVFIVLVGPHFQWKNFLVDSYPAGHSGVFAAIPYAIWFFLAIEGVAMAAEEVRNPSRDIPIGYISGILTLVFLALAVMFVAGGVGDWKTLSHLDYPVPEALAMAMGHDHPLVKMLAGIGLFGLVASLNGIIYSSSRQVFALSRAGLLPVGLARLNPRFQSPHGAVLLSAVVGIISLLSGKTSELITLSALGAVLMYILSMVALLVLRRKEPNLPRPFRVPFYPYFPMIALVLSGVSFSAMTYYNLKIASIFVGLIGLGAVYFAFRKAGSKSKNNPRLLEDSLLT